jgi:hypothetical protein
MERVDNAYMHDLMARINAERAMLTLMQLQGEPQHQLPLLDEVAMVLQRLLSPHADRA